MMFLGEFSSSITTGNRIAVPKQLREQLGNGNLVLTRGYEGCVVLISEESFQTLLDGVADVPFISADKRDASRFLMSGAHRVMPDNQGRVVVAESLVAHASLTNKDVTFLGVGAWVEIWDTMAWKKQQARLDSQSKTIADRLMKLQERS